MSTIVLAEETPTARKHHRCDNCQCSIAPGERYLRQRLVADGEPYVWKSHADCWDLAMEIWRAAGGYLDEGVDALCEQDRTELGLWRGFYPHAVTRTELGWELARQYWARRAAE